MSSPSAPSATPDTRFLPPQPPQPLPRCGSCGEATLGPVQLCAGLGQNVRNYNRYYQKCACGRFMWHGPETPIDQIPEDVLLQHALNKSLRETGPPSATGGGLVCLGDDCIVLRNGQPRRANKSCVHSPPLCASCCKLRGRRCKAHKVAAGTEAANTSSNPTSQPPSAASPHPDLSTLTLEALLADLGPLPPLPTGPVASAISESTGNEEVAREPTPVARGRSYARPLSEDYAAAYIQGHRRHFERVERVDAERRISGMLASLVKIAVWLASGPAQYIKVSTPYAGSVVLAAHSTVVDAVKPHGCIEVYALGDQKWALQELDLPIPVSHENPAVLVRVPGLRDDECIGLEEEVATALAILTRKRGHGGGGSIPSTPTKVRKLGQPTTPRTSDHHRSSSLPPSTISSIPLDNSARGSSLPPTATASDLVVSANTLPAAGPQPGMPDSSSTTSVSFPLPYVCDMQDGMEKLLSVDRSISEQFSLAFPGIKYTRSTFYRHRSVYRDAKQWNLVDVFASKGRTTDGLWSALVKEVEARRAQSIRSTQQDTQVPPIPVRNDAMSLRRYTARIEWFEPQRGWDHGSRWDADHEHVDVYVGSYPLCVGHLKECYLASVPGTPRCAGKFVAKLVREDARPEKWLDDYHNDANLQFREAERFARGSYYAHMFLYEAGDKVILKAFKFASTFALVIPNGKTYMLQQLVSGTQYVAGDNAAIVCSLSAFSHYCSTRYDRLYTGFQAVYDASDRDHAITIYDCKTHTVRSLALYLEDGGSGAVYAFAQSHVCNEICKALDLRPMPTSSEESSVSSP
ncbi:hypothetical protein OH76DRAFT_1490308 [Lentinus brumalis]|uniref:Alpha-type protein kinase domain-containing protein n=1 Tax=Lentinus brumalis TaxID=2498619 RepID=A0A371CJD1_9APHY|nr:hypothetical protein OH76DRAFT_1490308 [Polyporus brumalis]